MIVSISITFNYNYLSSAETSPKILNLKTVDSAVMSFSLQNQLTRYDKAELMALKETKAAQSPPLCEINPRIVRLNILNEQNHSEDTEKAENQDLLPALNNNNWDSSNLMALFNNYQKAMLYPQGKKQNFVTLTMTFVICRSSVSGLDQST